MRWRCPALPSCCAAPCATCWKTHAATAQAISRWSWCAKVTGRWCACKTTALACRPSSASASLKSSTACPVPANALGAWAWGWRWCAPLPNTTAAACAAWAAAMAPRGPVLNCACPGWPQRAMRARRAAYKRSAPQVFGADARNTPVFFGYFGDPHPHGGDGGACGLDQSLRDFFNHHFFLLFGAAFDHVNLGKRHVLSPEYGVSRGEGIRQ